MRLKKPITLRCENCKKCFDVELDFDCVSTDERDMGIEYDYEGIYDGQCPQCGKDIYIQIEAYEYPEGFINEFGEQVVDGATIESEIELEAETSPVE